jgi:hypothetical protein
MHPSDEELKNVYYNLYKNQIMLNLLLGSHLYNSIELEQIEKIAVDRATELLKKTFNENYPD